MDYLFVPIGVLILTIIILSLYRSIKKRDRLSSVINKYPEKHVFNDVILEESSFAEISYMDCDVCLLKGSMIVFTVATTYYFFTKGFENESFTRMSTGSGQIEKIEIENERSLFIEVSYTEKSNANLENRFRLKFSKGISLNNQLLKYSIL